MCQDTNAVVTSEKKQKTYKNIIRFNISNPVVFGEKSIIFGYERILKNYRSFSINMGQASFKEPRDLSFGNGSATLNRDASSKGFHGSADYRFYLKKENKFNAPRGVYIGPYYSYNYFDKKSNWTLNTPTFQGKAQTELRINMHTAGFELGYQFVFWNRFSIDLVLFGPGMSWYTIRSDVNVQLSEADRETLFKAISDAIAERFPAYNFAFSPKEFNRTGSMNTSSLGFRYLVHFGYRF